VTEPHAQPAAPSAGHTAAGHTGAGDAVTIAVLSDTQTMTERAPDLYRGATAWLAEHAAELGLRLVLHVGDVVNRGDEDEEQYRVAADAHRTLLDAGLPLLVTSGNHDNDDQLRESRQLRLFNRHVGAAQLAGQACYRGSWAPDAAENSYALLDGPDGGLLALALEFGPRPQVVQWADRLLTEHADRPAFLVTHAYLDPDASRTQSHSRFHPRAYVGSADGLDGEQLWDRLVRRHANLVAVFCGHQIPGPVSYRVDLADDGHGVLQSFQNWQSAPADLLACVRLVTWQVSGRLRLRVINTATGEWEHRAGYEENLIGGLAAAQVCYPGKPAAVDVWRSA
jgi:hypothetical protein